MHLVVDQPAGEPDVFSCLKLVARQHPHFDASCLQVLYRLWHLILQLVLDSGGAQQLKIGL